LLRKAWTIAISGMIAPINAKMSVTAVICLRPAR
jgi:hypothetical protein